VVMMVVSRLFADEQGPNQGQAGYENGRANDDDKFLRTRTE